METIRKTQSAEERETLLHELGSVIEEDVPALFLYTIPYTYLQRDTVKGFMPPPFLTAPHKRFENIESWHVRTARVVRGKVEKNQVKEQQNNAH